MRVFIQWIIKNASWLLPLAKVIIKTFAMKREGLLSSSQEKKLAKFLDEKIKFKNVILEQLDEKIFRLLIGFTDNNLIEKIPIEWINPLEPIIDLIEIGDEDQAISYCSELINSKIDIPGINEEFEQELIELTIKQLAALIKTALSR